MTLTFLLECVEIHGLDVTGKETSPLGLVSAERHGAEWSALMSRSSATLDEEEIMAVIRMLTCLSILATMPWMPFLYPAKASDDLPRSFRVGPLGTPRFSYEHVSISTLLAYPDRYQMRDVRLTGTITAMQTEIVTNRMICGAAHERTVLTVEDNSGQIEVIDQGACGKNLSALKAPMVKVGEQIDLLVQIMVTKNPESRETVVETTVRFLDRVRY